MSRITIQAARGSLPTRRCAAGFTLIEVLIATVVLSIGLLGLAGLQLVGVQNNQSAYQRTQASFMAYDILDRMRGNLTAAQGGSYDITTATDASDFVLCIGVDKDCTPAQLALHDLRVWRSGIGSFLGQGTGAVVTAAGAGVTVVTITVQWFESASGSDADGNLVPEQLTVSANL